jgi:hypothetical protein
MQVFDGQRSVSTRHPGNGRVPVRNVNNGTLNNRCARKRVGD